MKPRINASTWRTVFRILLTIITAVLGKKTASNRKKPTTTTSRRSNASRPTPAGDHTIAQLFARKQSDTIVEADGTILKILPDDLYDEDGSGQHQQFLVQVPGDVTIKIAHNLKFGRAPVREGDRIQFKGEYEWNDRGGCVHWTHHDPKQWREDGWIEYAGKRYG